MIVIKIQFKLYKASVKLYVGYFQDNYRVLPEAQDPMGGDPSYYQYGAVNQRLLPVDVNRGIPAKRKRDTMDNDDLEPQWVSRRTFRFNI